jgi:hypothetical protein
MRERVGFEGKERRQERQEREQMGERTHSSEACRKMADDVILKVFRLEQLGFEEVVAI